MILYFEDRFTSPTPFRPDVVVVDPPRKGLDLTCLETICRIAPPKVVYVSCDPATLARDLALLRESGYRIGTVQPVDQFCQTTHVETVVLLRRENIDDHLEFTWTDEEFGKKKGTLS